MLKVVTQNDRDLVDLNLLQNSCADLSGRAVLRRGVYGPSHAEIVGSNTAGVLDVCVC